MLSRRLTRFLLIVILLVAVVWLAWDRLLAAQGIARLDWQGLGVSSQGVAVDRLELERIGVDGSRLVVSGANLSLAWPTYRDERVQLPAFAADVLDAQWHPGNGEDPQPSDPQALLDSLRWVPQRLDARALSLDLPCAAGRCRLQGSLQLDQAAQPASLHLKLQDQGRVLLVQSSLQRRDDQWQLDAQALLDGKPQLSVSSQLQANTPTPQWSGHVQLAQLADTRGLFSWLSQWQAADERLLHAEAAGRLDANWQVRLAAADDPLDLQRLQEGSGRFDLDAYVQSPQVKHADIRLQGLALNLKLDGQFAERQLQVQLKPKTTLAAAQLNIGKQIAAQTVTVQPAGLELRAGDPQRPLSMKGPLTIGIGRLQQANVHPLGWRFKGNVEADLARQTWRGALSNDVGLALDIDGQRGADGALALNASLGELFFRAGNPLSKSFTDWPALLELANGRLQGKATLRLPASMKPLALDVGLQFKGLDGIYDRSELRGVSGRGDLRMRGDDFTLELPELSAQQANPGLAIGPLAFEGRYAAKLANPVAGRLTWQQARAGLFGGEVWLKPGEVDLSQGEQRLALQLKGLQLAEVFRVYPAEGLAGNGTLDGELPVLVDGKGVRVEEGAVAARAPGVLQFRSEKIRALGRSNPGMKLVSDALDDFHYELLDSAVSYDQNGKLKLGLRLQGRNPDLEKGRPINLNVNLEEDLPALLTSLQLTDKVSETIRQRVQERLRQRNSPAP